MLDFTGRIDQDLVVEVTRRVVHAKKVTENNDPRGKLMTSWRQQNRFWGLHATLFEHATGIPFEEVLCSLKNSHVQGNNPNDEAAARAQAIRDKADAIARGKRIENVVFEKWSKWTFFPEIIREVFEIDPDDLRAAVIAYDHAMTRAVVDFEPRYHEHLAEEIRRRDELFWQHREMSLARRTEENRAEPADVQDLPHIFRLTGDWSRGEAVYLFQAEEDDLLGHPELLHPVIGGLWELLRPWAVQGGMTADYQAGTIAVRISASSLPGLALDAGKISDGIRSVLALDTAATPLLSETKAISILKISREDFRGLAGLGEIAPWRTLCISKGPAAGKEFPGYAPRDILELRDRLHEA